MLPETSFVALYLEVWWTASLHLPVCVSAKAASIMPLTGRQCGSLQDNTEQSHPGKVCRESAEYMAKLDRF